MPKMFFHLHECGTIIPDEEGRDVPDISIARELAIEAARAIMCAELADGRLCLGCHIEIVDETGGRLLFLPFRDMIEVTGL